MTVSKRQFTLLKEMGINIWQQKKPSDNQENSNVQAVHEADSVNNDLIKVDLNKLSKQQLFTDIIQSIGLSIGEVTLEDAYLNIGLLNWQFTTNNELTLKNNLLTTPPLAVLAQSTNLKSELWQLLQSQALT